MVKSDSDKLFMYVKDPNGKEIDRMMGETRMESKFDVISGG